MGDILKRVAAAVVLAAAFTSGAQAQDSADAAPRPAAAPAKGEAEAIAEDAADYARRHDVSPAEAARRLHAQEASVAVTERLRRRYARRLAGISIRHAPDWSVVVMLTGRRAVRDRIVEAGGLRIPVSFRTGAAATQAQIGRAMARHRGAIQAAFPRFQGMGADPATGELVLIVRGEAPDPSLDARMEALTGVPVRIRAVDGADANADAAAEASAAADIEGGARVEGVEPASGRRLFCTTGFTVTDGARSGVVTAAHCPDELTYYDPDGGGAVPLRFVGGWGAQYQDVQVHVSERPHRPVFYGDSAKRSLRSLTGARARASIRGGDTVCHRGETTGYSCAEVELVDYAPPGDLCGGPCDPVWVTVAGPQCRGGDSGGPVFLGTTAFGLLKGSSYRATGACNFYYFMSTDYLPEGWRLLTEGGEANGG